MNLITPRVDIIILTVDLYKNRMFLVFFAVSVILSQIFSDPASRFGRLNNLSLIHEKR